MKGKAIYQPAGKAAEYGKWACNFYTGCSNDCDYCYCKRGVMAHTWSNTPKLKACFRDKYHALQIFKDELQSNLVELQKHGLFFSFTTDPCIWEPITHGNTINLTYGALLNCVINEVPVKILTKRADWVNSFLKDVNMMLWIKDNWREISNYIAFGFTLTGHDELEPNASTNAERIEAMRKLHKAGFKTWASIEPIIDFHSSKRMIQATSDFCDHYKIGLMSGKKYDILDVQTFIEWCAENIDSPVYLKDSLIKRGMYSREELPLEKPVTRDYNIFNDKK